MSQPWQPQPNQYGPPQPPQQPGGYGYPGPYPPQQQPMAHGPGPGPGYPYGQPGFPPPPGSRPKPGLAILFGLLISFGLTVAYTIMLVVSYEDLARTGLQVTYLALALALAAGIGMVTGNAAGRNVGSHIAGAAIAALGAFFAVTNGYVGVLFDAGEWDLVEKMLEHDATAPAEFWWKRLNGGVALLGLAVAGGGAFLMAHLVGKKKPY